MVDNAGPPYLTQPDAHCVRVTPRRHRRRRNYPAYTVLKGRIVGVFTCPWDDLKDYVLGVPHANYKGYDSVAQAQAAYMIGYGLGVVETVDGADGGDDRSNAPTSIVSNDPTEEEIYEALERASSTFLGPEWVVVFRGVRPGVYPSWNFVSSIVSGVSTAVYEKFSTRREAEIRWRAAVQAEQVTTLLRGVSYVRRV
ncbi:hypothetical protein HWV62_19135 [Athelia sp. TMB]|nr:hypothetical protein HWV62_19135 [Athelia sp. TMB]